MSSDQRKPSPSQPAKPTDTPPGKPGDRATGPEHGGKGAPKGPRLPGDTTAGGDDKKGRGEDNQSGRGD